MLDHIRKLYREKGLDAVWRWAKDGKNSCARAKRFAACAVFARRKAKAANEKGDNKQRETWRDRQETYHRKAAYYSEKCRKSREPKAPQTGCGDCGSPNWGGGMTILEREVVPLLQNRGVPITSRKRTSTLSNPSSDHYVGNTCAYAVDAGTFSGADDARAVASKLGISGYSTGNYNSYYISRCGRRFRIQILWAVSGHFNHVHVGCRRL